MAPSTKPTVASPPRNPRSFDNPGTSPPRAGAGSPIENGAVSPPIRGRRARRQQANVNVSTARHLTEGLSSPPSNISSQPHRPAIKSIANPSAAAMLMGQKFPALSPNNTFSLSPASLSAAPRLPEQQLSTMLQLNTTFSTSSLSQRFDSKEFTGAFELAVPLRNRRMSSPAEMHPPRPRCLTISSLSGLQAPFGSPQKARVTTLAAAAPAYQIRNPVDLFEVIQAYPTETFTRIQDLGRENICLKDEIKFLRNENKFTQDSKDRAHKNHSDTMMAQFDIVLYYERCKQNLLHSAIERFENQIIQLKGGGRMVQGEWMGEEAYVASEQTAFGIQQGAGEQTDLAIQGKNEWDVLVAQQLSLEAEAKAKSPTPSNDSDEVEGVKDKGKDKGKEKPLPQLDPNAQSFVPSVASSPSKSDITEIFSPIYPSQGKTAVTSPAASHSVSYSPATYTSFLHSSNSSLPLLPLGTSISSQPSSSKDPFYHSNPPSSSTTAPPERMPDSVLNAIISTLPPLFRTICPFSLSGLASCPVKSCPMRKLCKKFNNQRTPPYDMNHENHNEIHSQMPDSDRSEACEAQKCKYVHEYATCTDDLQYLKYVGEDRNSSKMWCQKRGKRFTWHSKKRIHKSSSEKEEWRVREAIAGLKEAHRERRYL